MRIITLFLLFISSIYAVMPGNETCKGCHPTIYNEYNTSLHKKSTIYEDKIHKAIWDLHPGKKKGKYVCAKCHTPTDKRVLNALKNKKEALPKNDIAQHNAISCIACHSIKSIEEHKKPHNKNISVNNDKKRPVLFAANINNRNGQITYKEETSFFGMFKSTSGSPYHDIDYRNKNFYNGNICMGCHQHKANKHGQEVCETDKEGSIDEKSNCITCHMPKINGTATTIKITKQHTFHGFAGTTNRPDMLSQYVNLDFKKLDNGFEIVVTNKAKHNLLLHPLRLAKLNIAVTSDSKITNLKSIFFYVLKFSYIIKNLFIIILQ